MSTSKAVTEMAICTKYSFESMMELPRVQGETLLPESNRCFIPKQAASDQQKKQVGGAIGKKAQRHLIRRPSPYDREEPNDYKDALKRVSKSEQAQRPQEGNKPNKFSEKNKGKGKMTPLGPIRPIPFASLHQGEKSTGKLTASTSKSPETTSKDNQTQSPKLDRPSVNHEKRRGAKRILDPTRVRPWKTTAKHMTEEQQAILTSLFNHICAGTRDPVPVREVERELNRLNCLISSTSRYVIKLKEEDKSPPGGNQVQIN